jgi:short-subunit dehydrogenase
MVITLKKMVDKVIIVTGASSGIGAATARRLARPGVQLTLAARRQDRLEQVAREIESLGAEVLVVQTDLRQHSDILRMVEWTLNKWGSIDVLFNNAGVVHDKFLIKVDPGDIQDEIRINLTAMIECAQAVIPSMLHQKSGHIVNITSMMGLVALPQSSVYSATRFGVVGFSDSLRRELRGTGIQVSMFCPGYTPTELTPGLKAIADGQPDAPRVPSLLSLSFVAEQAAWLVYHPRRLLMLPRSWRFLTIASYLLPGFTDRVAMSFLPKKKTS